MLVYQVFRVDYQLVDKPVLWKGLEWLPVLENNPSPVFPARYPYDRTARFADPGSVHMMDNMNIIIILIVTASAWIRGYYAVRNLRGWPGNRK